MKYVIVLVIRVLIVILDMFGIWLGVMGFRFLSIILMDDKLVNL